MAGEHIQPRQPRGRGRTELFSSSSSSTSRSHASSSSSKYNPRMDFRTTSSSITNAYNKTKSVGRNWVEDAADDVDQGTDLPNFIGTCLFMCSGLYSLWINVLLCSSPFLSYSNYFGWMTKEDDRFTYIVFSEINS